MFLQNIVPEEPMSDGAVMAGLIKDQAKMMQAVACAEVLRGHFPIQVMLRM